MTWLVTGASRGLGRELALQLVERGFAVLACARDAAALAGMAAHPSGRIRALPLDLGDAAALTPVLKAALHQVERVDGVINNAGIGSYKPFADHSEAELRSILQVNLGAVMQICHAVLPWERLQPRSFSGGRGKDRRQSRLPQARGVRASLPTTDNRQPTTDNRQPTTRRRREPGHDWCVLALARPGTIEAIEVDTCHFKGNFPDRCSLQAAMVAGGTPESLVTQSMFWPTLLPEHKLQADHQHHYRRELLQLGAVSHVRFNIHPDGGVSRLRLRGRPA
jgi:hypothetical protein